MKERPELAVDDIMDELRERVRARKELTAHDKRSFNVASDVPASLELYDLDELRAAISEIEIAWKECGTVNPRPPGFLNDLVQLLKKAMRRSLTWYTRPQNDLNGAVARSLGETERALEKSQANLCNIVESLAGRDHLILARLDALNTQIAGLKQTHQDESNGGSQEFSTVENRLSQIERLLQKIEGQLGKAPAHNGESVQRSVSRPPLHGG